MITQIGNPIDGQISNQRTLSVPFISTKQSAPSSDDEFLPISALVQMFKEKGIKPHNIYNWFNRGSVRRGKHPTNDTAYLYNVSDVARQVAKGRGPVWGNTTTNTASQAAKAAPVRDSIILKLTELVSAEREKNKELTAQLKAVTTERDELLAYLDSLTAPKSEFTPEEAEALKLIGIDV